MEEKNIAGLPQRRDLVVRSPVWEPHVMKKRNATDAKHALVYSPLCQRVTRDGIEVDIQIYKGAQSGWLLEVVDPFWNSTVWDDSFSTDNAALAEALKTIDTEGIASLVGSEPSGSGKDEEGEDRRLRPRLSA